MKRVLIITNSFPPYGNVGSSIRIVKFVKYLPEFSWQPIVLSMKHGPFFEDNDFASQINKKIKVYYTRDYMPTILSKIRKQIIRARSKAAQTQSNTSDPEKQAVSYKARVLKFIIKLITHISSTFIFVPDTQILWLRIAYRQASKIIKTEKIESILTTSPSHSTHLIGLMLKLRYRIPWIAEFRDQWVGNPATYYVTDNRIRRKIHSILEKKVVTYADIVVSVTESGTQKLANSYSNIKSKFITITNGFDLQDFELSPTAKSDQDRMTFAHVGCIDSGRNPEFFLKALSEIKNTPIAKHVEARFIGTFQYNSLFWEKELPGIFICKGEVAHKDAIREMFTSDVLLIFQPESVGSKFSVPGKLYEYMATGHPILAMVSPGPAKDLIEKEGLGVAVNYEDVEGIKKTILKFHSDWQKGELKNHINNDLINKFSRKNLTKDLVEILNTLTMKNH